MWVSRPNKPLVASLLVGWAKDPHGFPPTHQRSIKTSSPHTKINQGPQCQERDSDFLSSELGNNPLCPAEHPSLYGDGLAMSGVLSFYRKAKLHYTSCLDGVWIKMKKVWINPNNSHESLDRSKLRPSQTPTIHPSEFFGHITFSVPNIKL